MSKTTWIIGDIHGMYDPLKCLLTRILSTTKDCRFIFLGDYIDYGPSSKEVIDLLLGIKNEKIFLTGNHDDMLAMFMANDPTFTHYNNPWFGNGGQDTMNSFFLDTGKFYSCHNKGIDLTYEMMNLSKKYEDFIKNLKYSYEDHVNEEYHFVFSHALPSPMHDLQKQLQIKTYEQLHQFACKDHFPNSEAYLEESHIWNRYYRRAGYDGRIIIHGHTPTIFYEEKYSKSGYSLEKDKDDLYNRKGLSKEKECLYQEFLNRPEKNQHAVFLYGEDIEVSYKNYTDINYYMGKKGRIDAINIDTGAVFGGWLTALGYSGETLANNQMKVISVKTGTDYRRRYGIEQYEIEIHK